MPAIAERQANPANPLARGKIIEFIGTDGNAVFNPTPPLIDSRKRSLIVGRVEDNSSTSFLGVFLQEGPLRFSQLSILPVPGLEDPFLTTVNGQPIFGCVKTYKKDNTGIDIGYKTVFYKPVLDHFDRDHFDQDHFDPESCAFAEGPPDEKDIRLVGLPEPEFPKRTGVFTRPQGGQYEGGRIGFTIIDTLDDLNEESIRGAQLIKFPFDKVKKIVKTNRVWGGVNSAYLLKNGLIGALGHVAYLDAKSEKNYLAITFMLNPVTLDVISPRIAARREDFPSSGTMDNGKQIIFPAGFSNKTMWTGIGDSITGVLDNSNPFAGLMVAA